MYLAHHELKSILTTLFIMQAEQQADSNTGPSQDAASAGTPQALNTGGAPYALKFSNHLGDIRMQKKWPSIEDESVLYFTAQWEQEGEGVYDVSKLTHPEACICTCNWSDCY